MSVVTGALGILAPKLLQLLGDEYKLQKGVKKRIQWLSDELNSIYAFLRKVEDVPWDRVDEQVKVWAREVREASYDMEDVLDSFLVRVDGGDPADPSRLKRAMKKMGKVFSKAKARRDIAGAIEDLKKHLVEVAERRQKYRLDDITSKPVATTSTIDPRLSAMYKEVTQLVGIDKSRDELISMLIPSNPYSDASNNKMTKRFSIVGVGGLGKTTLAKAVFDKLKSQYDCGAFVSVGRELDLVKVFKDTLFDLDKCKYQNVHNDGRGANLLIRELREFLDNKSYYDMPSHLRTCLLYLSTYPEDYFIDKERLIQKWIAEGFIYEDQGKSLFEIGESYFDDLINRSMIQSETHSFGDNVEGTFSPGDARRLAHQNALSKQINTGAMVVQMPKVRSYTAYMCCTNNMFLFSSFKLLRVLHITECKYMKGYHLEHIGILQHLRYLRLRGGYNISFPDLPKEIGDLKLLQTLDVDGRLPENIVKLTQLVCLCARTNVPVGIEKLTCLEVLRVSIDCSMDKPERFMNDLGFLRELRVLEFGIYFMDESMQINLVESLRNLQRIQHIEVYGGYVDVDTALWERAGFVLPRSLRHFYMCVRFSKLPSCINPSRLPNLSHMGMGVVNMDERDLKLLAGLPALCFLELLIECTVTASNIDASDGFFQKLTYLIIHKSTVQFEQPNAEDPSVSLHIWNGRDAMPFGSRKSYCSKVVSSGVMPNLEWLRFRVNLRALLKDNNGDCGSFGLEYLPSLREVHGMLDCRGVSAAEGDAALAELRNACEVHPNHPTLDMWRSS